ncbi:hypothetical protein DWU98_04625 [Dyella monticola]|uniref:PH domain-containing protein n=2 Tax=Dyella monticola TaxID=1927958 RepID=A0A370X5R2_9GAMM|nr:hypothetical protein DWU98_04625 [Dyella monticola]
MIALNMVTGYHDGWRWGWRGFLMFGPFWLFAVVFALLGRCSIVIDDMAIAKHLFGYTWEKIRWDELGCAKVRSVRTRMGTLTVFVLEKKAVIATSKKRRLWFTDEVDMLGNLIGKINRALLQSRIPVYDERFGKTIELRQLPAIIEPARHELEATLRTKAARRQPHER